MDFLYDLLLSHIFDALQAFWIVMNTDTMNNTLRFTTEIRTLRYIFIQLSAFLIAFFLSVSFTSVVSTLTLFRARVFSLTSIGSFRDRSFSMSAGMKNLLFLFLMIFLFLVSKSSLVRSQRLVFFFDSILFTFSFISRHTC